MTEPEGQEERLLALEARLCFLEDEREIRQLICSYGPAVDSGNSTGAAELWSEDGIYDYTTIIDDHTRAQYLDQRGIVDMLEASHHQRLIHEGAAHTLGPPHITITGDTAVATNYSVILRRIGMSVTIYRMAGNRWDLVRRPAGWRVHKRTTRMLDGSAEARALLGQAITG